MRGVGGGREARLTKDLSRNQHTGESRGSRRRSIRVEYVHGVPRDVPESRRLSPHDVFRAIGECEARARTERAECERGRIASADRVTVAVRRVGLRRGRANANRPGIYPRILNVPLLVRAISTISRSRKREQLGILTCDQNGYSNQKVVLRRRATGL